MIASFYGKSHVKVQPKYMISPERKAEKQHFELQNKLPYI